MRVNPPPLACTHIWHKYRPVILRLMIDADGAAQHYSFSSHEFTREYPKRKTDLAFLLYLHRSKALNNIKSSELARSLLLTLQESKTVTALTSESTYEFLFDKHFVLHVRKAGVEGTKMNKQSNLVPDSEAPVAFAINPQTL